MVNQLDFGLPPNLTECFNLKFENNRGFIHTKVRKNDRGTSKNKNNVCLLPPFGSRHSLSSCNLCLKDKQKRPQFFWHAFRWVSGAFRLRVTPNHVWHLPKRHTSARCFRSMGNSSHLKGAFCFPGQCFFSTKNLQGKGKRKAGISFPDLVRMVYLWKKGFPNR